MRIKIATIQDINKNNKRACLSVNRVLNRCFECQNYSNCESKIKNIEYEKKVNKIKKLKRKIEQVQKQIEKLED